MKIKVTKNGPYIVSGNVPLYKGEIIVDNENYPTNYDNKEKIDTEETYALCRCGKSKNYPFCDASHLTNNFDGTEIAKKHITNDDINISESEKLKLEDIPSLCDHSRFCTRNGGVRKLMEKGDTDHESFENAKKEATLCPSGRLTIIDKTNNESTNKQSDPEIVLLFDNGQNKNGPIWVRGDIAIECEDGQEYDNRNRYTLCRCGKSENKPSCDGSHWVSEGFQKKFKKRWKID
ncbi:CDGSH iron-sulfur domain-containing protein [Methanobrevibacter sp. DSM 116169]|uniref:CDGSH iron-sulfur domain-containing protein n=1 Tax=Methanobrevibacter sp. DSM 116169 TaxID=3242727 RepID=UPI0038FC7617